MKKAEKAERTYQENLKRLPRYNEYVYNQLSEPVGGLRFGTRGRVDSNGCGAVALHNMMKYIGKEQNFCDVIRDEMQLGMVWMAGRFGTKPWTLGRYFMHHKIPFQKYKSPNDFKAALLTHRIGVVCTWNSHVKDGMHYYCIYYSKEENRYYAINERSSENDFAEITLEEIGNFRLINGYVI